jgi:WD40 repeat protein
VRPLLGHRWAVHAVAFAPDEPRCLVSAGTDRVLRVWDTFTGMAVTELRQPSLGEVRHLTWTRCGTVLVGGDRTGHLFRWKRGTEEVTVQLLGPARAVQALALLDESRIVLGAGGASERPGGPGYLARWHLGTSALHREPWQAAIRALAWSVEEAILAVSEEGRHVHLIAWDEPGRSRRSLTFPHEVATLQFVPTDPPLLAIAHGTIIELVDPLALARRRRLGGHRSTVTCLAHSPDGRLLLTGSRDRTVRIWSLPDGGELAAYHWEIGPITGLAVAPDGQTAAVCGEKSTVIVWDLDLSR